jgi:hypothetical protein
MKKWCKSKKLGYKVEYKGWSTDSTARAFLENLAMKRPPPDD